MNASEPTSRSGENVSEDSAESSDWEDVGRELLLQRLEKAELDVHDAIHDAKKQVREGRDVQRMHFADLVAAKSEIEEVLSLFDELTEPFVYEREDNE